MARICRPVDWFGLNHYGPIFAKADPNTTWGFGWGENPTDVPESRRRLAGFFRKSSATNWCV